MRPVADSAGMSARSGAAGFTLLEVMIAVAIVAMALVALLGLQARNLEASGRQQMLTRATMLAAARLAELEASPQGGALATQGVFAAPDDAFSWQVALVSTPLPQVLRVEMTVSWGEGRSNEAVTLVSVVQRGGAP